MVRHPLGAVDQQAAWVSFRCLAYLPVRAQGNRLEMVTDRTGVGIFVAQRRQISENPGREWDLTDQESQREAKRDTNQRRQGKFEELLRMDSPQREGQ